MLYNQSVNITLQSIIIPQDHPHTGLTGQGVSLLWKMKTFIVWPPVFLMFLMLLKLKEYQAGFLHSRNFAIADMNIIFLGLPEWIGPSKAREIMLRFEIYLGGKSFPLFHNWSTEYLISS